jgi:hypothetical protein
MSDRDATTWPKHKAKPRRARSQRILRKRQARLAATTNGKDRSWIAH